MILARISPLFAAIIGLLTITLTGCFHPPFNDFKKDKRGARQVAFGTAVGAGTGAVIGTVAGSTAIGTVVGGVIGGGISLYNNNQQAVIRELNKQNIIFIAYGDTRTLLIPTDHYFLFDSPRLNDLYYPGLNNIIRLLSYYPNTPFYVAGFTDDIGSRHHKRMLSQARAETMLTFLWANSIKARRLHAEGYADKHNIGDNLIIHGSAYNRRIEIQWLNNNVIPKRRKSYA